MRALCQHHLDKTWAKPKVLVRNALQKWGAPAAAVLREFVATENEKVVARAKEIDAEIKELEPVGYKTLAKRYDLAAEKWHIQDEVQKLADLAEVLTHAARERVAPEAIPALCRCYTRRRWQKQNELIVQALRRQGAAAVPAIRAFLESEKQHLADLDEQIVTEQEHVRLHLKPYCFAKRDRLRTSREPIPKGMSELAALVEELGAGK